MVSPFSGSLAQKEINDVRCDLVAILEKIHGHQDLVNLNEDERTVLCSEIRDFLVLNVAKTGGHLASNLGVVELTVALETVFDTQKDRLVFDVAGKESI